MFQGNHRRSKLLNQAPGGAGYNANNPSDGDLLVYDTTTDKWVATQTLDGVYTFTQAPTFNALITGTDLTLNDTVVQLKMQENDASTDEGFWEWRANAGILNLFTATDLGAASVTILAITRSGLTVPKVTWTAAEIAIAGDLTVTGSGLMVGLSTTAQGIFTAAGSQIKINESDGADTDDFFLLEHNAANFNIFSWDDSASVFRNAMKVPVATGIAGFPLGIDVTGISTFDEDVEHFYGTSASISVKTLTLADDATGTFDIQHYATVNVVTSFSYTSDIHFKHAGQAAVSLYTGTLASLGTAGVNPDTDTHANYWMSATTTLSIKNRLGSTRTFSIFVEQRT